MTTNESSGLTKYKLLLAAFEDEDRGTDGETQGKDRGTLEQTREAWKRGQALVKGKWGRLGNEVN